MKNIFRDMTLRDISASYEGTIIQVNSPDDDGFYPAKLVEVSCDEYVYVKFQPHQKKLSKLVYVNLIQ